MKKKMKAQKGGAGILLIPEGYAMNAKPAPEENTTTIFHTTVCRIFKKKKSPITFVIRNFKIAGHLYIALHILTL